MEGDTLVFFTTGYASDMNMNGRGMEAKTKTILTYVTEAGGTGQFLTNGRLSLRKVRLRGILPLRSRESCWKAGDGQTLPVPCFPENKGVIFREKEGGGKGAFPPPFLCFVGDNAPGGGGFG